MRRLFWTFPNGLPGIGLLLLRIALSGAQVDGVVLTWQNQPSGPGLALSIVEAISALGLLVGFFTPLWSASTGLIEVWKAGADPVALLPHGLMASIGASLALLGPGAVSIDAWLFGWRRVDVRGRR